MVQIDAAKGGTDATTLIKELSAGGISGMIASAITNPLDVVKTRVQTQRKLKNALIPPAITYDRFYASTRKIAAEEGVIRGLFVPGIGAALLREVAYSSIRFGLYAHVKTLIVGDQRKDISIGERMLAGMITGGIGSAIASPTDLVKIRLQAEAGRLDPITGKYLTGFRVGELPRYRGTFSAFSIIYREQGVVNGLYRGSAATCLRAALLTGGQLASYEQTKIVLKERYFEESVLLHALCSLVSSFTAATVCAPADFIKTRLLADSESKNVKYKGIIDCFYQTVRYEGPFTLYRGWLPSYLRLAPHFIIAMPVYEQLRLFFGLKNL